MDQWTEALRRYRLADVLSRACEAIGPSRLIEAQLSMLRMDAKSECRTLDRAGLGSVWRGRLDNARRAADTATIAECNLYHHPADDAAIALLLVPAPDIDAVNVKLAVIESRELDQHPAISGSCFELIEADVRRLSEDAA